MIYLLFNFVLSILFNLISFYYILFEFVLFCFILFYFLPFSFFCIVTDQIVNLNIFLSYTVTERNVHRQRERER